MRLSTLRLRYLGLHPSPKVEALFMIGFMLFNQLPHIILEAKDSLVRAL